MSNQPQTCVTTSRTDGKDASVLMASGIVPVIFVSANSPLCDKLWEYSTMDDCDYVLLVPRSEMSACQRDTDNTGSVYYEPRNPYVERMLQGPCDTYWTIGTIDDVEYGIGYAYHA
jgi:hypothetical protein